MKGGHWFKLAILVLAVVIMSALAWMNGAGEWLAPARIIVLLQDAGPLAPFFYMILMAGAVVISPIPSLPLDLASGTVFGTFWGTVYSVIGAEAGAVISFFIARALGREAITRLLKNDIGFCDLCAEHHLFYIIFLARLLPVFSFDIISYGAGLTRISPRYFALATLLGVIPPTFLITYFGGGIFSGSGYTILLGGFLVLLFFLIPVWITRKNPWGLYQRIMLTLESGKKRK
ncbi:MAG: hypothetical protein A2W09_03265 [Deltaproteobacteria bacterium RBG_16_50_11]|nr:MAG: hypothetical protein A2W09_03265 [Deltaproteobacteria bacterium RBG_16_50_11]